MSGGAPIASNAGGESQESQQNAEPRPGGRWISLGEVIVGSLAVLGANVWHVLPNSVLILFVMACVSFRLRNGSWAAMGFRRPTSWLRIAMIAVAAAVLQQAIGQYVVDPLTHPFAHYSPEANPLAGIHGSSAALRWFGIIWTYAAFGEEVGYRGYLLNRVADLGAGSSGAYIVGLMWSSTLFGCAHWYQGSAGVISSVVSGCVFGSAYLLARRNLWAAVGAHGLSDTLALIATMTIAR